ncbi:SOS mutagenesis and repair protein UmuC [Flavobacterium noncentrifugens]|uniref:DNA polymerase V n=1 Tax=Flavobacterium noncentrifugens TaxID=1128970 RepID=A0A1G9AJA5_9FLAO|nr:Y-family DNA polymerase [Flavobacterium noncentrifugens]GEP51447.1 SOS mutagenesis and repair protein UmuC [Flavobacterium noncentrifugens]SDK26660.1 DNA polymerase V [Flavobacterium noncentrifugens]
MYALVDCNNFYASCERLFRPELVNKPIVVLSNNDGCIISRSDEAKELGVKMAAPEFKVRQELKEKGITVFSSNYALYGDLSDRVMQILRQFTQNIEVYSIDEAFMDFQGVTIPDDDFHAYGIAIKNRIRKWVSIPVCVGVAPTKALSKVANKIARKFPEQTIGVYVIDSDEKRIKALKWTKIGDIWGIGHRMKKKLEARGLKTAFDFTQLQHEAFIKSHMGVTGLRLIKELQGEPVLELEELTDKKSIATTRSFPKRLTEFDPIRERVATFASVCAEKLRMQKLCCHTITVLLGTMETQEKHERRYFQQSVTLPFATHSTLTISEASIKLLEKLYAENKGLRFHKAGVIVTQLIPENQKQFNLFEDENPKHLALMKAIDHVNQKIGGRKIRLGSQDEKTWNMTQNLLSPRYTTQFDQILTIQC